MRVFIGFDFNEKLKDELTSIQNIVKHNSAKGSWVSKPNFHITLKFLGEIDNEQLKSIDNILQRISSSNFSVTVKMNTLGYFNKKNNEYGVVWAGLCGEIERLKLIYDSIENEMSNIGFTQERRKFSPHITLGRRVILNTNFSELRKLVDSKIDREYILDNLVIMKSEVIMKRRIYTPINSYNLKPRNKINHR